LWFDNIKLYVIENGVSKSLVNLAAFTVHEAEAKCRV
jgi:hypothetical protein